jgi:glycerol uptake facilitator-like aquaporin
MRFKKAIIAALAVSMTTAPVMAQSASSLSLGRAGAALQSGSSIDEDTDYLLPALVITAILAAAILWTSNKDSKLSNPRSP